MKALYEMKQQHNVPFKHGTHHDNGLSTKLRVSLSLPCQLSASPAASCFLKTISGSRERKPSPSTGSGTDRGAGGHGYSTRISNIRIEYLVEYPCRRVKEVANWGLLWLEQVSTLFFTATGFLLSTTCFWIYTK